MAKTKKFKIAEGMYILDSTPTPSDGSMKRQADLSAKIARENFSKYKASKQESDYPDAPEHGQRLLDRIQPLLEKENLDAADTEILLDYSKTLLAVSRQKAGLACPKCKGFAEIMYASTSTWRGGGGGSAITTGVCDQCWGTGQTDKSGPDLRKLVKKDENNE
jgi:hypothetical protein